MPYREDGVGYRATDTSEAAAPANPGTLRAQVLAALQSRPMTCDELCRHLRKSPFSIRPRITELRNAGLVTDSGDRRLLQSGKNGIVWQAAEPREAAA